MSSPQRISSRHTRQCSTELATIAACARVSVPAAPGGGGSGGPAHGSGHAPRQSAGGGRACGAEPGCNGRSLMTAGPAVNAPRSVSYFTFGRRKMCEPHLAKMRDENASHRMDQLHRPGCARPALVGCRDVQIGPHAQRGNQLGLDAVRQSVLSGPAVPAPGGGDARARRGHRAAATMGSSGSISAASLRRPG
jgi:hypothetical protein